MSDQAALALDARPDIVIATLRGELDMSNAVSIHTRLLDAAADGRVRALVLDLTGVTYLDSSTVHLLFELQASCRERNASLRIVAPVGSRASRVLALAGMAGIVPIAETVQDAIVVRREEPVGD